jgi:hypothetical protein
METQTHMFYGDYDIVRHDIKLSHTKIEKHHHYLVMHKTPMMAQRERAMFYPNYFYFAVPSGLVDLTVVLVQGLPYGVFNLDMMRVVTKTKSLCKEPHDGKVFLDLFSRSCTMKADLKNQIYGEWNRVLELVAVAYKLEPASPGYMRLMQVRRG